MALLALIEGNRLTLKSGATVEFAFPIGHAIEFANIVVVRIDAPRGAIFNENVYGIGEDGRIIWQVPPEFPADFNGAWGALSNVDDAAVLSNSESRYLVVDPATGVVMKRGMQPY